VPSDIRNLRYRDGYWTAELHSPVGHVKVNERWGSWMIGGEDGGRAMAVLPHVAAQIQEAVKAEEKRRAAARAKHDRAEAAKGRVRARVKGASQRASRESNGSRVPSRLS
jgi:hypothetical protein